LFVWRRHILHIKFEGIDLLPLPARHMWRLRPALLLLRNND
jgi:hypothetical protein